MSATVLGVPELLAKFLRMAAAGEVAQVAARDVVASGVADTARSLAPVLTGTLRDSIVAEDQAVRTDVPYAPFVEYGTSTTPAQPFMRPAADTADGGAAEVVAKQIMDAAA